MSEHTSDSELLDLTLGAAVRDSQTTTSEGERTDGLLEGMTLHRSRTHTDERGTLTEILDPRWDWHPDPIVYVYFITERPRFGKGWALHKEHEDRYFVVRGELIFVSYDVRPDSATRGQVCKLALSEKDHFIVNIPRYVWHATLNPGNDDAIVLNLPTVAYEHENPDKYRLPLDTPLIPYSFGDTPGW